MAKTKKKNRRSVQLVLEAVGKHPRELSPALFGAHGTILAQSGSGKSFLLGRLVEELILTTKGRFLIIDPNSDFLRLNEVNDEIWTDPNCKDWFYPGEGRAGFATAWSKTRICIVSNRNLNSVLPVRVDWGQLSPEEMATVLNVDERRDAELFACITIAAEYAGEQWPATTEPTYDFPFYRERAHELIDFLLAGNGAAFLSDHPVAGALRAAGSQLALRFRSYLEGVAAYEIWRHEGENNKDISAIMRESWNALVLDLQSLATDEERLTIVARALEVIWQHAKDDLWEATRDMKAQDRRVPTFIIIDEAHNLVPAEKTTPAIAQAAGMLVRIAAEGRKYGLFLIVSTQRPRKIDGNVLSECENLILMKMKNETDLAYASEMLGYLEADITAKARSLRKGDALLRGNINITADVLHTAPRRTQQGGKSLDERYWAEA